MPHRPLADDYFGRTYTYTDIEQALRRDPGSGLVERHRTPFIWRRESDIADAAAQLITAGTLIGWFQGGSELGPAPWATAASLPTPAPPPHPRP